MIGKIKLAIKIVLLVIQLSLSLVSAIGILSSTQILSSPDNITVYRDTAEVDINQVDPYFRMNITFNNRGAFNISDVSFTLRISIVEKPEFSGNVSKSFKIMDKEVSGIVLTAREITPIFINASKEDFSFPFLNDVWIEIGNLEYYYYLDLEVSGQTNLGLVAFKIMLNYNITGMVEP